MLAVLRAAIVVVVLLFVPGLRDCFEPPKAAILRCAGLALLVYIAVTFPARRARSWRPMDLAILGWLAIEALATLASRSPLLSAIGEPMQREGMITSLALAGIYAAARATHAAPEDDDRRRAERVTVTLGCAIGAVSLSCLYALAQGAGLDVFHWTGSAVYAAGGALARPSATFGHPNLLGVASAAAAAAALALAVAAPRRRVGFALAAAIAGLATVATLSRAAWLGGAAGIVIGVVLVARAGDGGGRRRWLVIGGLAAILAAILLVAGWGGRLAARFAELLAPTSGAGASRLEIWRSALAAWRARPWLGEGPDTFALLFHRFQTPAYWRFEWAGLPYHAHSILLHTLATRGALGALAIAAAAACAVLAARDAWRRRPSARPAVAALASSLTAIVVAGQFGALGIGGALWLVIGCAMLASLGEAPVMAPAPPPGGHRGFALAAAWVIAVAVAALGAGGLAASGAARAADLALANARAGDPEARTVARDAAATAARRSPLDDAFHRLHAEALLGAAGAEPDPGAAIAAGESAARRAIALEPERVENHEQLARLLAARAVDGDRSALAEAEAEIDRVCEHAPANALLLGECARLELLLDRPDRARAIALRITALYPDHGPALLTEASAELALGRRDEAAASLRRALAGVWREDTTAWLEARALAARLR